MHIYLSTTKIVQFDPFIHISSYIILEILEFFQIKNKK